MEAIRALGRRGLDFFERLGRGHLFLLQVLLATPAALLRFGLLVREIWSVGVRSLVIIIVSGTFVGDRLAVEIRAGGSRVRWVGGEDVLAPLGPVGPTMDGSAQLFRHRTGYVRVSANARGGLLLEPIVDNGNYDLEAPTGTIVATRPSDAPTMVTLADDHLYFCARDAGGRAALHRLALVPLGTATPVLPANDVNDPCRPPAGGGATANGAYWARWTNGGTGPMLTVLRMYLPSPSPRPPASPRTRSSAWPRTPRSTRST